MVLTVNNDPTRPLSPQDYRTLREECDNVFTYSEAGWFCVAGYKGDRRLVHGHCNSAAEYAFGMGKADPAETRGGYGYGRGR